MRWRLKALWMFLVLGLSLFAAGCGLTAAAQDPEVPQSVVMGDKTLLWGPEIKAEALHMIDRSAQFCHLTMYELSDRDVLDALAAAGLRGVDVEVVLDATESHSLATAVPFLQSRHIKVRLLRIPGGISHIKSLVTEDGTGMHALLGGMNFGSYSWQNHDASVYFAHAGVGFEGLFEQDYARAGGDPASPVEFAPPLLYDGQIESALLQAVGDARQSVVIEAFAFTSHALMDALAAACARGVHVSVLLDPHEPYNRRTASELSAAGVQVDYYSPYQGEYLHAKIASIDHGKEVFVGSANFSYHGFSVNHEGDVELGDAWPFAQSIEQDATVQMARGSAGAPPSAG